MTHALLDVAPQHPMGNRHGKSRVQLTKLQLLQAEVGPIGTLSSLYAAHQVAVQNLVGYWTDGIYHQGTNCDVWHEAAVHDINVDPVASSLVNSPDLHTRHILHQCNVHILQILADMQCCMRHSVTRTQSQAQAPTPLAVCTAIAAADASWYKIATNVRCWNAV